MDRESKATDTCQEIWRPQAGQETWWLTEQDTWMPSSKAALVADKSCTYVLTSRPGTLGDSRLKRPSKGQLHTCCPTLIQLYSV